MRFSRDPERGAVVIVGVCLRLCLNQVWQRNAPRSVEWKNVIKPERRVEARGDIPLYETSSTLKFQMILPLYITMV